jgi:hypothetical protein
MRESSASRPASLTAGAVTCGRASPLGRSASSMRAGPRCVNPACAARGPCAVCSATTS